uniref:MYND-type domain-containing protein n=1 Tax=Chromera velia CCMP2878 TaxID=1169474 RepID=A0A0G4H2Y7_9ALVE|eukprot:Cvel_24486.t1-p1 / transcript=Cvel_24486.t1 / gene=Cvel_24486 / organism=Chromera_velia_CCMP2878 / gene_product=hypothetical protein / transcript_product=hypothetical protein / location=Cvel_scaffold2652:20636-21778(-) / protein_length=381 / sequence_SO=supercontig / SO=protein_coding / is_pseudo=false
MFIWKSHRFRRALKRTLQKVRVKRGSFELVGPVFALLGALEGSGPGTQPSSEAIHALNNERSEKEEEGGAGGEPGPIDVSDLLRANFWYAKELVKHSCPEEGSVLYNWGVAAKSFRNYSLASQFYKAAAKAFAEREANADAVELFKMATSGWEKEKETKGDVSVLVKSEYVIMRALAIQCTLSNPAVEKYIKKNRVKILVEMHKMAKSLELSSSSQPGTQPRLPIEISLFTGWLEATSSQSQALSSKCIVYPHFFPSIEWKKLRLQDLPSMCETAVHQFPPTDFRGNEKPLQKGNDSFLPTKAENRKYSPLPCSVCKVAVPSFMYCGVCKLAVYCGKECQKRDWKRKPGGHKERCALLKKSVTNVLLEKGKKKKEERKSEI